MIKIIAAIALLLYISPLHNQGIKHLIDAEIHCLAMNIYHEAGSESRLGKIAVGHVTMNRVKSSEFPKTVCGVITQTYRGACQFSWFCSNKIKQIPQEVYQDIRKIAKRVYYGEVKDNTRGALFFHNHTVSPPWATEEKLTVEIGNHKFYRK